MQEITKLGLLQELLGQVLQVALGERKFSSDDDLGLVGGDLNLAAKVAGLAVDLDAVVQELVEGGNIEDLVLNGLPAVNSELGDGTLATLLNWLLCKMRRQRERERYC